MLFEPPLEGLKGNVRTPPIARWKAPGRLSKSAFSKGVGDIECKSQTEGGVANHCWCQKTRVISCGITVSAMHCLVLSQGTRVTDGQTYGQTDRQDYDS